MPVDEFGIRADIMIDMNSPVARNNPGQLYETGINRISEFVRRQCATDYETKGSLAAFETLMSWYGDVNPNYEKLIREGCVSDRDKDELIRETIETSPRIWVPPFLNTLTPNQDDFWNALANIRKWADKWGVRPTPVTYKTLQPDGTGKEFTTKESFSIGSKYILHLHKIPEQFAPGPASVNHIGVPTKSSYDNRHYPVSVSPYRYGEDELRVMAMDTDIREVTRFQNLGSNSPVGVNVTIQSILLSKHPTRIKRMPISNGKLYETSAILRLFHNTTATLGVETKNTADVANLLQSLSEANEDAQLADSIWEADIVDAKDASVSMDEDDEDVTVKKESTKRSKFQKMISSIDTVDANDGDQEDNDEITEDDLELSDGE